jgi:hypothetical protein
MVDFNVETPRRQLVTTRRYVPADRIPEYAEIWALLHYAATARGAHAWWFASATHRDVYMEFLEFDQDSDPAANEAVVSAIRTLSEKFNEPYPPPLPMEHWVALPTPPRIGEGA